MKLIPVLFLIFFFLFTSVGLSEESHKQDLKYYYGTKILDEYFDEKNNFFTNDDDVDWLNNTPEDNYNKGLRWFKKKNIEKALLWYKKAALQGHVKSQETIGMMYAHGQGVVMNYQLAYAWLNLAASNNASKAIEKREILEKKLTPELVSEAQNLSLKLQQQISRNRKNTQ